MKKRFSMLLCVLVLTSCDYFIPSTWNYRITVEIETPEGIKTGSAVRRIQAGYSWAFNPDVSSVHYSVSGEAVAIDLGTRGIVFALIDWDSYNEFFAAFPHDARTLKEQVQYYKGLPRGMKAALERKYSQPKMVVFKDINNPKSVKLVYVNTYYASGAEQENHFEEIFGKGVKLTSITIETTDDAVTWEIGKDLPWLNYISGGYLDGQFSSGGINLSNILHGGNFKKGEK